jgi:flagellar motor protein MotB
MSKKTLCLGLVLLWSMLLSSVATAKAVISPEIQQYLAHQGVSLYQDRGRVLLVMFSDKVFSSIHPTQIAPESYVLIDAVSRLLNQIQPAKISIRCFSSNQNLSRHDALTLTRRQARHLAAYFWSQGVPYLSMRYTGGGQFFPIAANTNNYGVYSNNRVEIRWQMP